MQVVRGWVQAREHVAGAAGKQLGVRRSSGGLCYFVHIPPACLQSTHQPAGGRAAPSWTREWVHGSRCTAAAAAAAGRSRVPAPCRALPLRRTAPAKSDAWRMGMWHGAVTAAAQATRKRRRGNQGCDRRGPPFCGRAASGAAVSVCRMQAVQRSAMAPSGAGGRRRRLFGESKRAASDAGRGKLDTEAHGRRGKEGAAAGAPARGSAAHAAACALPPMLACLPLWVLPRLLQHCIPPLSYFSINPN